MRSPSVTTWPAASCSAKCLRSIWPQNVGLQGFRHGISQWFGSIPKSFSHSHQPLKRRWFRVLSPRSASARWCKTWSKLCSRPMRMYSGRVMRTRFTRLACSPCAERAKEQRQRSHSHDMLQKMTMSVSVGPLAVLEQTLISSRFTFTRHIFPHSFQPLYIPNLSKQSHTCLLLITLSSKLELFIYQFICIPIHKGKNDQKCKTLQDHSSFVQKVLFKALSR